MRFAIKLFHSIVLMAMLVLVGGCSTAQGFGRDLENLGLLIQGKKRPERVEPVEARHEAPPRQEVYPDATPVPPQGGDEVYIYPYNQTTLPESPSDASHNRSPGSIPAPSRGQPKNTVF